VILPAEGVILGYLTVGPLDTNCYVVGCRQEGDGLIIDPGVMLDSECRKLEALIDDAGVRIRYIVNTHGHADHIAGNRRLKSLTGAQVLIHRLDLTRLTDASLNGSRLFGTEITSPAADRTLEDGDEIVFGIHKLTVIHTPGHTPGSISLLGDGYVFTGDTLFVGKVGGTDFESGARAEYSSLHEKILKLPGNTIVYPGHDYGVAPFSTIEKEIKTNPFLLQPDFESFVDLKKNWQSYKRLHGID